MVFSSVPVFLDPPNWPQQQNQLQGNGSSDNNLQLPPPPPPPPSGGGSGGTGSIRPGSMTDRARMAKMPQPEAGLKCPRCESTNTKFCYFNNYSLTQPRHFCKTCRRYWTRGGAMRNVPVGGGCRRSSKRSSKGSNRSKSPAGSNTSTSTVSSNSCTTDIISHLAAPQAPPHLPFLAPLHHLSDFGNISLNFEGLQIPAMASGDHHHQSILSNGVNDNQPWKIPFFANLQQQNGLYSSFAGDQDGDFSNYQGSAATAAAGTGQFRLSKPLDSGFSQLGNNLKMEETVQGLNLSRNFLGQGNDQFWSNPTPGNAWTDQISDHFTSSSSTSHLLLPDRLIGSIYRLPDRPNIEEIIRFHNIKD